LSYQLFLNKIKSVFYEQTEVYSTDMQKLTKAEEEIMQWLWQLERATVSDILDNIGEPRPPHSTVSSFIRILEKKEFVGHKAYGKTYEYFPLITKEEYSKLNISDLVRDYFDGSVNNLVSFLVKKEQIDVDELQKMIDKM
jgi:BlaI family transcriptional regulator, penicillinase repressor